MCVCEGLGLTQGQICQWSNMLPSFLLLVTSLLTVNCASVSSAGRLQPVIYGRTHAMVITCKCSLPPSLFPPPLPPLYPSGPLPLQPHLPNLAQLSTMGPSSSFAVEAFGANMKEIKGKKTVVMEFLWRPS